jgi:hypothetical protein
MGSKNLYPLGSLRYTTCITKQLVDSETYDRVCDSGREIGSYACNTDTGEGKQAEGWHSVVDSKAMLGEDCVENTEEWY